MPKIALAENCSAKSAPQPAIIMQKHTARNDIHIKFKREAIFFEKSRSKSSPALFKLYFFDFLQIIYPKKENRKPTSKDTKTPHDLCAEKKAEISCPDAKPAPNTVPKYISAIDKIFIKDFIIITANLLAS